jgi:hypothetical protein
VNGTPLVFMPRSENNIGKIVMINGIWILLRLQTKRLMRINYSASRPKILKVIGSIKLNCRTISKYSHPAPTFRIPHVCRHLHIPAVIRQYKTMVNPPARLDMFPTPLASP